MLLALAFASAGAADERVVMLHEDAALRFATLEEARRVLGTEDDWVRAFGPFDRQVRMHVREPVTNEQFLEFAAGEAREWTGEEIATLTVVIDTVRAGLERCGIRMDLPTETFLIKTTGTEEGGNANYTRANAVIMPERQIARDPLDLEGVMLHELFHVMTRHNPSLRAPLYHIIGFQPCNELEYPPALLPRKITNPDAFHFDTFIQVSAGSRRILAMPLTLSSKTIYGGGGLFDYVTIQLLEITIDGGDPKPALADGEPVLHQLNEVRGFWEQIGGNTRYVVHAEEIIAVNFGLAVRGQTDVANPEILDEILDVLARLRP